MLLLSVLSTCVDPVAPNFRFRDGFLLVNGQLTSETGSSRLQINRARLDGETYRLESYEAASVEVIDDRGVVTSWTFRAGESNYYPPDNFAGETGRSYFVRIVTPGDEVIESSPERMPQPVPFENFRMRFDQEAYFSDNLNRFIPSFRLLADFTDPAGEDNFYRWSYVEWDKLDLCLTCMFSRANANTGECERRPGIGYPRRLDYFCATDCYAFTNSSRVNVASDEFFEGNTVTGYEFGRVDWDWPGPLLIVAEQQAITAQAFQYQDLLRSLSEGSGGLNATLPAALDGNIDPIDPEGPAVLGYFSVVAVDRNHIFFDRDTVQGFPLPFDNSWNLDIPPPPAVPYRHPCEGPFRTTEAPPEWPQ